MNRILTFALSALILSAPVLAQTAPAQRKVYLERPIGTGDPSGVSCYQEPSSQSRVKKMDCKLNSEWAQINADAHRGSLIDTTNAPAAVNIMH